MTDPGNPSARNDVRFTRLLLELALAALLVALAAAWLPQ